MLVDVRGVRFSAALTTTVLVLTVALRSPVLLALQVAVFGLSAFFGLRWSPYGQVFRVVKQRFNLRPPRATEPEAGPRFAQLLGFVFTALGLAAVLAGFPVVGWGLVVAVLALSATLAITGLCVGCRIYGLSRLFFSPAAQRQP